MNLNFRAMRNRNCSLGDLCKTKRPLKTKVGSKEVALSKGELSERERGRIAMPTDWLHKKILWIEVETVFLKSKTKNLPTCTNSHEWLRKRYQKGEKRNFTSTPFSKRKLAACNLTFLTYFKRHGAAQSRFIDITKELWVQSLLRACFQTYAAFWKRERKIFLFNNVKYVQCTCNTYLHNLRTIRDRRRMCSFVAL